MEPELKTWWQRLRDWRRGSDDSASGLPAVGSDGLIVEPVSTDTDAPDKAAGLSRWAKRESALTQLQEGYERVNQLIADMQKHMAEQSQRTERMCGAIEQLARVMNDVPDVSREQARMLEAISGQLEAANGASRELAEAVGELPKVTRAQSEALTGIGRRLDMMNEQSVVGNQAMEKLNTALSSVGQAGQAQADLLRQLDARACEQNQRLNELLDSQRRRFTILIIVVVVLALAAIAASVLAVRLH